MGQRIGAGAVPWWGEGLGLGLGLLWESVLRRSRGKGVIMLGFSI